MNIPIIYEDNHLLVVEKKINVPVQADQSGDDDMLSILKRMIKVRDKKPGNVYLALVHRLDRPVGGVMVFAKTSKAASRLSDVIRRNKLDRKYLTVVRGTPQEKQARLEHFLHKDRRRNFVNVVDKHQKGAQKAILDYEVLDSREGLSLVSVTLHTGRSHQIRVQLSHIGHPIFGDQRYGQRVNRPGQQIALWAHSLAFPHTTTKEVNSYKAYPPIEYPWTLWPSILKR